MSSTDEREPVRIMPRITPYEHIQWGQEHTYETYASHQGIVEAIWVWDELTFRMDIAAPSTIALTIAIPMRPVTIYVNGESVWGNDRFQTNMAGVVAIEEAATALHLLCLAGGAYHILACAV